MIGARGFLGRALVDRLNVDGVAVAEFTRDHPFLLPDGHGAPDLLASDVVYYLATTMTPATAESDDATGRRELERLGDLLRILRDSERAPLVVLPSSGGTVYDTDADPPYAETAPTNPRGRFGAVKLAMERMVADQAGRSYESVSLRISNAYGPGQRAGTGQGVVGHWLAAIARRQPIRVIGDAETTRDYVYIDDVVDAFMRLLERPSNLPETINIASGTPTSLGELMALIEQLVGDFEVAREAPRAFDVHKTWLVVGRAKEVLEWSPTVSIRDGLTRTWDWIRKPRGRG